MCLLIINIYSMPVLMAVAMSSAHDKKTESTAFFKTPLLGGVSEGRGGLQEYYKLPLRLCETPPLVRGGAFDVAQVNGIAYAAQRML